MFAFSEVPYPGDDASRSGDCDECCWDVKRFRGKRWSQLGLDDFRAEDGDANVALLMPTAFHLIN